MVPFTELLDDGEGAIQIPPEPEPEPEEEEEAERMSVLLPLSAGEVGIADMESERPELEDEGDMEPAGEINGEESERAGAALRGETTGMLDERFVGCGCDWFEFC
jgi:hypothetical protein